MRDKKSIRFLDKADCLPSPGHCIGDKAPIQRRQLAAVNDSERQEIGVCYLRGIKEMGCIHVLRSYEGEVI